MTRIFDLGGIHMFCMCVVFLNSSRVIKWICKMHYLTVNALNSQCITRSDCTSNSMGDRLLLPVFSNTPPPVFLSPPPACHTPPVNTRDRAVLLQISWNKCFILSCFLLKYFLLHRGVQIYTLTIE